MAVGISSGANFLAALKVQDALGGDAVVATVFADDNKKYLSTDLLRDEPVKSHYLSTDVTLREFRTTKRVCNVCCDADDCAQRVSTSAKASSFQALHTESSLRTLREAAKEDKK